MTDKPKNNYIDPEKFLAAMKERIEIVNESREKNLPLPKASDYIGQCLIDIAHNFANLKSYRGYPFKDEMIFDAIENCVKAVDNFDVRVTENPFAYFTQITYFAFLRRIAKEKRQVYIRSKLLSSNAFDLHTLQEHDESGDFTNHYIEYMKAYNNFDGSSFEKPKKEKVKKEEPVSALEEFYGESDTQ